MSRLSDTTFLNPFFLAVKMRCITSMGIKIFTIDVAGLCAPVSREEWCKQWNMKHKLNWMLSFKVRRNIWAWMWASEFFVWLSAARLLSGAPCQHSSALASNWFTISVKVFIEPQLTALSEHRPRHSYQLSRGARSMALSFISSEDWAQDISQIVQLKLIHNSAPKSIA